MAGRVQDKIAIVTGGGTGIGEGIATLLAREGARVVVANRSAATGEAVVNRIRDTGGTAFFQPTDVTREAECVALVEAAVREFGRLDVLVNNAGVFPRARLEETTEALWDQIMSVNLKGAFFCCKHAVPALRQGGGGSIINVGSINGYAGAPHIFAYSVSKGGLLTLTRNLARSLAPDRIRVNYLNPGWVITETETRIQALEGHDAEWLEARGPQMPLGRFQAPQDAAYAAVYLASDESSQVTGDALNVGGGVEMR
jgi:NAD(P)-dependent dehydrogenase (short-subunit alcohol dehydrogenase family)